MNTHKHNWSFKVDNIFWNAEKLLYGFSEACAACTT